jgi:hypothetical protein
MASSGVIGLTENDFTRMEKSPSSAKSSSVPSGGKENAPSRSLRSSLVLFLRICRSIASTHPSSAVS